MKRYDLVVIGGGPGGYVAAIRGAQLGLKTACIDKRATLGGTCLNVGCIPSKTLLYSSEFYAKASQDGTKIGLTFENLNPNFQAMIARKNETVKSLVDGVAGLFSKNQVEFIRGEARFIDSHTLEIENQGTIQADYFIIATGSEPIELKDLPFDENQVLSSTGALSLSQVPKQMAVIGGGVIGVELASVYSRLGCQVTVIEMLDHICPAMDQTICKQLLQILKKQGMQFQLSTRVVTAVIQPNEVILTLNQGQQLQNLSVEKVLVAVGRKPYTKGLGLDKIRLPLNTKGFIAVDSLYRTNQPHIFAIGDVVEGPMLAHRASADAMAVVEWIKGSIFPVNYLTVPNVIYTSPEVAAVGLTEEEARQANLKVKIGTSYFRGNPRARCTLETEGSVKIIGEERSDRIIGLHIIGFHASELIEQGIVAIQTKTTLTELAYSPYAHPTLSEAIKEAALNALGKTLHG